MSRTVTVCVGLPNMPCGGPVVVMWTLHVGTGKRGMLLACTKCGQPVMFHEGGVGAELARRMQEATA